MHFILIFVEEYLLYNEIHDFSLWLRTSNKLFKKFFRPCLNFSFLFQSFLLGLMLSSALALAAADKNFQSAAVGRRGRQVLTGFRNGQALTNGAVVRKVLRRGRGQLAPTLAPALTPIRQVLVADLLYN